MEFSTEKREISDYWSESNFWEIRVPIRTEMKNETRDHLERGRERERRNNSRGRILEKSDSRQVELALARGLSLNR